MKVLTFGGGFVASHLPYEIIPDRINLDSKQISDLLDLYKPDTIVNCVGKTGRPNIDWCESHKEETTAINTALPILLAEECKKKSIHLVQIGSGCIFFGKSPNEESVDVDPGNFSLGSFDVDLGWKEDDFANPKSHYSKSKYACDLAIGKMDHVSVLRIRMPISNKNDQRNLINKLKGYQNIIDIPNSVTFMDDLVRCVDWTIKGYHTGIYHVTNPEPLTAARVMREYQKHIPSHRFSIIDEKRLLELTLAPRSNCILNTDKLNKKGFHLTHSEEALKKCMAEYIQNI